jgi:hypothetical protein
MNRALVLFVAASAAVLPACRHAPRDYPVRSIALLADEPGPAPAPGKPAPEADHTKPTPLPDSGVFIIPANRQTVSGTTDLLVQARRAGGNPNDGFTGLVTTTSTSSTPTPYQVGLKASEVKVAMPIGLGIFRGSRPHLTTAVVSAGAEGSTLVCWATPREQWVVLLESRALGQMGTVHLLTPTGSVITTEHFTNLCTLIRAEVYAEDEQGQPVWRLLAPRPLQLGSRENDFCRSAWQKARTAGVIPTGTPYPGPGGG